MNSRLAAVIPVRNSARTIVSCIEAVLSQSYENFIGVWLIGTEHDDNTWEALGKYRNHPLVFIVYIQKPKDFIGRDANLKRKIGCQAAIDIRDLSFENMIKKYEELFMNYAI